MMVLTPSHHAARAFPPPGSTRRARRAGRASMPRDNRLALHTPPPARRAQRRNLRPTARLRAAAPGLRPACLPCGKTPPGGSTAADSRAPARSTHAARPCACASRGPARTAPRPCARSSLSQRFQELLGLLQRYELRLVFRQTSHASQEFPRSISVVLVVPAAHFRDRVERPGLQCIQQLRIAPLG